MENPYGMQQTYPAAAGAFGTQGIGGGTQTTPFGGLLASGIQGLFANRQTGGIGTEPWAGAYGQQGLLAQHPVIQALSQHPLIAQLVAAQHPVLAQIAQHPVLAALAQHPLLAQLAASQHPLLGQVVQQTVQQLLSGQGQGFGGQQPFGFGGQIGGLLGGPGQQFGGMGAAGAQYPLLQYLQTQGAQQPWAQMGAQQPWAQMGPQFGGQIGRPGGLFGM
jgi:hypothetical protein